MTITNRRFKNSDAEDVADLVAKTMLTSNTNDYPKSFLEKNLRNLTPDVFIKRAKEFHCYVFVDDTVNKIVAVGSIGPYWGSKEESSLFNIFVDPEYQGQGIGRKIIEVLERDSYFIRAKRIEIPASKTGLNFYLHMGYDYKNGANNLDETGYYRLEKFNNKNDL
ncbi:GNAT family N-acetyltransferase [Xylocopilactobacillus apis]|uniref:N-acetyltransferase n=1 Tax=Xylocopilactobacillus apis TaxID=2932183 RepID=A0AAU9D2B0_9LACO|nr:GNAT family N-acetyltransferase [Xylocopilactobacillus apis]BDR56621.1 N-acetyltransferase [Xylocopilactobacillus apis]